MFKESKIASFGILLLIVTSCQSTSVQNPSVQTPEPESLTEILQDNVKVAIWPSKVRNGGLVSVRVKAAEGLVPRLVYRYLKKAEDDHGRPLANVAEIFEVKFSEMKGGYFGLLPIHYDHVLQMSQIEIQVGEQRVTVSFEVIDAHYRSEKISVAPKFTKLSKQVEKRVASERKFLGGIYRASDKDRHWFSSFSKPVMSEFTSPYGTQRVFNGKKQSVHQGVDLRAPTGTKILTPAKGRVAVARDLFFTGWTVIMDHGLGLFTIYAHLSEAIVKEGDIIDKGVLIGLSGATGRASGPHLHWGAQIGGIKIDPVYLIESELMSTD